MSNCANFPSLRIVSHVNLRAEDGATALMMAAQAGRVSCVQLLLDFGADVNIEVDMSFAPAKTISLFF